MNRALRPAVGLILVAALGLARDARADFEVTGPDGRRILLKDDRTWSYVEGKEGEKPEGHVLIQIEHKIELARACRFRLRMVNNLPYEVTSLIPQFSAYKANDVLYETVFIVFSRLRPTDRQVREVQFQAPCSEIVRLHVSSADGCDMGDLSRFSAAKGKCLERLRVEDSDVVRFTK